MIIIFFLSKHKNKMEELYNEKLMYNINAHIHKQA